MVIYLHVIKHDDKLQAPFDTQTPTSRVDDDHAVNSCQSNWNSLSQVRLTSGPSLILVYVDFLGINLKLGSVEPCDEVQQNIQTLNQKYTGIRYFITN